MKRALARFMPAARREGPPAHELWRAGVLEHLPAGSGLTAERAFDVSWAYEYADDEALAPGMLAAGLVVEVLRTNPEDTVRATIIDGLPRHRTPSGSYRLTNEWHCVVTRA